MHHSPPVATAARWDCSIAASTLTQHCSSGIWHAPCHKALLDRALPMYAWWADLVTAPQTLLVSSEPEADFHSG